MSSLSTGANNETQFILVSFFCFIVQSVQESFRLDPVCLMLGFRYERRACGEVLFEVVMQQGLSSIQSLFLTYRHFREHHRPFLEETARSGGRPLAPAPWRLADDAISIVPRLGK